MATEKITFNQLIPELSVRNLQKSIEFYLDLGFHIVYTRETLIIKTR